MELQKIKKEVTLKNKEIPPIDANRIIYKA